MARFQRLSLILLTSCAALSLAACDGASSVASPGEGGFPAPAPAPTPAPSPSPSPTPTPGTPAAACPTGTGQALTDVGTIGAYRICRLPTLVTNLSLPSKATAPGVAYEINGRVDVGTDRGSQGLIGQAGSLTIGAGAILFANTTNADNDFLIVNRGSTINAQGTATSPIIFTAQQNLAATTTDDSQGLWGGVILAGRSPVANCITGSNDANGTSTTCENVVEGTGNALYGGNAPGDSSGVFQYVQIRYSGTVISPNNELQGLTLAGVGSGTTIDHVQVHNSSDDGIEIFGGTAQARHLVLTGSDDDGLDFDVGWRGLVQFLITAQKPGLTTTDTYSMEVDSSFNPGTGANPEDALPRTWGRVANATLIQTNASTTNPLAAIRLRGSADLTLVNSILVTPGACLLTEAGTADRGTIRAANPALQDQGPPRFNSIYFACGTALTAQNAVNGNTITTAEQDAFFTTGGSSGNTTNGTAANALQNGYFPTATTLAVAAFDARTLNPSGSSFLVQTNYIGAVSGSTDTWFQGWTCNSNRASFGTTSGNCTAL
ncbi:hypothetical protein [Sphingomonas sp. Root241]|uniref:hypothetical protein n=1 Tax=Sphingomonas sp. Root241 TaxID=1736501 RepID=UPI0006F2899F|nr:hypothetical protein [Sphingomonas sp. Root241]KRC82507.1 hypothetical protein ASE13_09595 [Sphingomonas sp. Root241]